MWHKFENGPVDSLVPFVEYLQILDLVGGLILFRGQGVRGNLIPGIGRNNKFAFLEKVERRMLEQFRLQGASLLPRANMTDLELLVLAQHYEMKTRLLDWTTNPLAALWFACSSRESGDVYLYALDAGDLQSADIYDVDPFGHERTLVFQPRLDNPRILAQNGWFTLHAYSEVHPYPKFVGLELQTMGEKISEIRIAEGSRSFLLASLERMGVHARSMFPDLTGLARHLNVSGL
jgi:hypothetical protein